MELDGNRRRKSLSNPAANRLRCSHLFLGDWRDDCIWKQVAQLIAQPQEITITPDHSVVSLGQALDPTNLPHPTRKPSPSAQEQQLQY